MTDEKRVFSPESLKQLLTGWLLHAHKARDRHDLAARIYARGQYLLGVPTLLVSTIVGTSVFSALASKDTPPLWVGILSIAAAALSAVQTFVDYGGRSGKHLLAAVKYKAAIRNLEHLLMRLASSEQVSQDDVDAVQAQLDTLEESAPVVMPKIYDRVEQRYRDVKPVRDAMELYRSGPVHHPTHS